MGSAAKIARVDASGVLGEFDYSFNLGLQGAERMRVIYAPNGQGKTNLLRALSHLLNPSLDSFQALIDIPIRHLRIEFSNGAMLELVRDRAFAGTFTASIARSTGASPTLVEVGPSDFAGRLFRRAWDERPEYLQYAEQVASLSSGAVLIGDDRLLTTPEDAREASRSEIARRRAANSLPRLLERVERMLTQLAITGFSREGGSAGVYDQITRTTLATPTDAKTLTASAARKALETQILRVKRLGAGHEKYGLLNLRQVRAIQAQIRLARANDKNFPTLHRIVTPYLESLEDQIENLEPAYKQIDTFVTAVNRFLDRKQLSFRTGPGIQLRAKNQTLDVEGLSSGERHLLHLLSQAVLATSEGPLVIVDEPEISLGLEWQRDLLAELLRCTETSNVQFVVASHSVQIMGHIPGSEIVRPTESRE